MQPCMNPSAPLLNCRKIFPSVLHAAKLQFPVSTGTSDLYSHTHTPGMGSTVKMLLLVKFAGESLHLVGPCKKS